MTEKMHKDRPSNIRSLKISDRSFYILATFLLAAVMLTACIPYSQKSRLNTAQRISGEALLIRVDMHTPSFPATLFEDIKSKGDTATLYIGGKPLSHTPVKGAVYNPTPRDPVGLRLAAADKTGGNIAYIAPPCTYLTLEAMDKCDKTIFADHRYSEKVLQGYDHILARYRNRYDISGFHLVGYSGGATTAALLADRHPDVVSLRTVAGELDLDIVAENLGLDPLYASRNPAEASLALGGLPQHHFLGDEDTIVTADVLSSYVQSIGPSPCVRTTMVNNATHHKGWVSKWPSLLKAPVDCRAENIIFNIEDTGEDVGNEFEMNALGIPDEIYEPVIEEE